MDVREQLVFRSIGDEIEVMKVNRKIPQFLAAVRQPVSIQVIDAPGNVIGGALVANDCTTAAPSCVTG